MRNLFLRLSGMSPDLKPVLATVTGAVGSTPQKAGSTALFDRNGLVFGTVGGGLTEGRVAEYAKECAVTGISAHLHFLLNNDVSDKAEPICGGEISVLVDATPLNHLGVFREIVSSLERGIPGVLLTMVTKHSDTGVLINRYWITNDKIPPLPEFYLEKISPEALGMIESGDCDSFRHMELSLPGEEPGSLFLLETVFPLPHLIIAGAGHIGRALSHQGRLLDFQVTVIDDRAEYANRTNLPDADQIIVEDVGLAMSKIKKDYATYIVIVTRGHGDDASALKPCIGCNAAYVGMIGSRPKVAKMRQEFIRNGWATEETWNKIYTPVGLEINSKTVEEIAVSIAAQLVKVRNS